MSPEVHAMLVLALGGLLLSLSILWMIERMDAAAAARRRRRRRQRVAARYEEQRKGAMLARALFLASLKCGTLTGVTGSVEQLEPVPTWVKLDEPRSEAPTKEA